MPSPTDDIDWGAQSLRVTVFAPVMDLRVDELFEKAFAQRPNAFQASSLPGQLAQASGVAELGQIAANFGHGRLDLILSPPPPPIVDFAPSETAIEPLHAVISEIPGALSYLTEALLRIVNSWKSVQRCALGIDIVHTATTKVGANRLLSDILPYRIELTEEDDFILQKNDVYSFKLPHIPQGISINTLSRWSVNTVQQMQFVNMQPGTPMAAQLMYTYFIAQKSVDINTASPLPPDAPGLISDIFLEFLSRAAQTRRRS